MTMAFGHPSQKQHMLSGIRKAAASPRTPAHLVPHLQARLQGGAMKKTSVGLTPQTGPLMGAYPGQEINFDNQQGAKQGYGPTGFPGGKTASRQKTKDDKFPKKRPAVGGDKAIQGTKPKAAKIQPSKRFFQSVID